MSSSRKRPSLVFVLLGIVIVSLAISCVEAGNRIKIKINTEFIPVANPPPVPSTFSLDVPITYPDPEPLSNPPVQQHQQDSTLHEDWLAMATASFTTQSGKFQYTVTPFLNVTQIDNDDLLKAPVVLGIWKQWTVSTSGHLTMLFTEGDRCSGGQRRVTHVFISCRTDEHLPKDRKAGDSMITTLSVLSAVSEPETCVYHMTLSLPGTSYLCNSLETKTEEWQTVPQTFAICKRQHQFVVDEVANMQRCIDALLYDLRDTLRKPGEGNLPSLCQSYVDQDARHGPGGAEKSGPSTTSDSSPTTNEQSADDEPQGMRAGHIVPTSPGHQNTGAPSSTNDQFDGTIQHHDANT